MKEWAGQQRMYDDNRLEELLSSKPGISGNKRCETVRSHKYQKSKNGSLTIPNLGSKRSIETCLRVLWCFSTSCNPINIENPEMEALEKMHFSQHELWNQRGL